MNQELNAAQLERWIPVLTNYTIKILGALLLLIAAIYVSNYLKKIALGAMQRARLEITLAKFGGNLVKWTFLGVALLAILGMFGVQTASFAAVIAAMGLAIGLAFQGTLSNFAAGVMLLVFRPFKVGHFIRTGSESGTVNEINIFTTSLDTPDKRRVILPNSSVFNSTIENVSYHSTRRCDVSVGTAYDADLRRTREVLCEVVEKNEKILRDPEYAVVLTELGSSSVNWAIRVYVATADYWSVREQLLWDVKYALDGAGIGIPFPQMDVHISKD